MKFFMCFAFVAFLAASFEVGAAEKPKEIIITPKPRIYSMTVKEFHECVSCNKDDRARTDFGSCIGVLSHQNQKIMKSCCQSTFDEKFCSEIASIKTKYTSVCKNPKKGLEVERCFWKKTNKSGADVEPFRKCKKQILDKYCTSKSGDW